MSKTLVIAEKPSVGRDYAKALAGTFVKSRDPSTTEALAAGGLDFVIADLEHSPLSVADVESIARAGANARRPSRSFWRDLWRGPVGSYRHSCRCFRVFA